MPTPLEKLVEAVLHRATLDREFRAKLLATPEVAIHDAFGVSLPAGVSLGFIEADPEADFTYVLPEFRDGDEELSDDDLDAAAGGSDDWFGEDPPT